MTLLSIFKNKYQVKYQTLVNTVRQLVPLIIYKFFVKRRQGTSSGVLFYPRTVSLLQRIDTRNICDCFLEAMLTPILWWRISSTVALTRAQVFSQVFSQFSFLLPIMLLEIFISSNSIPITAEIRASHNAFFDKFLKELSEGTIPNISNFERHLIKTSISRESVTLFINEYRVFSMMDSTRDHLNTFEKKLNFFILAFFEELELLDIFSVIRFKLIGLRWERSFVVFRDDVLAELREIHEIGTRDRGQSWPSLLPLNDWFGSFPDFGLGGALSNAVDQTQQLVHSKPHIQIHSFVIPEELFLLINTLQKQPFLLNPLYKTISQSEHELNTLWNADVKEPAEILILSARIKFENSKLKKPTEDEMAEYKKIKNVVRLKHLNASGNMPRTQLKLTSYKKELFKKTSHIFDKENVDVYNTKQALEKRLNSIRSITPKLERIKMLYDIGFGDVDALYYGYFLDFRSRIYATGWPIGLSGGYFKQLLQTKRAAKINIKTSEAFDTFWKKR
jgi:hypothetical protein